MRKIAIINKENSNFVGNILKNLPSDSEITVFQYVKRDYEVPSNVKFETIPQEFTDSDSKAKNYVLKHFFDANFDGFLHVIEDSVEIYNSPNVFLDEIERMMKKLNLRHWFNTITDPCNYIYNKYNPRFSVTIDREDAKIAYDKKIYFTSHANTSWTCYDYSIAKYDDVKFDESFRIAMYYIIHFLAQKRNLKSQGEMYYMNFYPSIDEEKNVFRLTKNTEVKVKTKEESEKESNEMQQEGIIFQQMNINHNANTSIEEVMDDLYAILKK